MCAWGNCELMDVHVDADLSYTGAVRIKSAKIDKCIAPIVMALEKAGIYMRASCCGHGIANGSIELSDGRTLRIETK